MRLIFRPGIDFLGFWLDLSLFTARCPSHACFQEFFILLCPRLKTAKIDRFWFATFIYFNNMAGVEGVYLSLASQEAPVDGGFSTSIARLFSFYITLPDAPRLLETGFFSLCARYNKVDRRTNQGERPPPRRSSASLDSCRSNLLDYPYS